MTSHRFAINQKGDLMSTTAYKVNGKRHRYLAVFDENHKFVDYTCLVL